VPQEGFKRKLTAILSADVEGYSRLMEDDSSAPMLKGTVASWKMMMRQLSGH
jgi:class 3 adenylate cyclase